MRAMSERRESLVTDVAVGIGFCLALGVLLTPLLWPLGKLRALVSLGKGYGVLLGLVFASGFIVMGAMHGLFRAIRVDPGRGWGFTIRVLLGCTLSGLLAVGWSAFAALVFSGAASGAPWWAAALVYLGGAISAYVAFALITIFYQGSIYKMNVLALVLVSYVVFAIWPAAAAFVLPRWFHP
jgi:hypothetical protein